MLPPYVIGCTAGEVRTWRWRYITLWEREENESTLSVHMSGTYYNCCVQQDGVCGWIVFSRTAAASVVTGMKYHCVHCSGPKGARNFSG